MARITLFLQLLLCITVGIYAQSPGGVSSPELWFKTLPAGTNLNGNYRWVDFSGDSLRLNDYDASGALAGVEYTTSTFRSYNGYPAISLDKLLDKSGNYNDLLELATSSIWTDVIVDDHFYYMDNNGKIQPRDKNDKIVPYLMSYQGPDPYFVDPTGGNDIGETTTGEAGLMGQTLLPGKGTSDCNSPNNRIIIIMNKNLTPAASAEMYSHEANGHALMYIRTKNRQASGHIFPTLGGSRDLNKTLDDMILRSKKETVSNMRNQ